MPSDYGLCMSFQSGIYDSVDDQLDSAMHNTPADSRVLKNLLREIYLLLLALLAFINFFMPAMIHTVYSPDTINSQDRIWVRLIPRNDFQKSLQVGRDIGICVRNEHTALTSFRDENAKGFNVKWSPPGSSFSIQIARQSQELHIGLWLANIPVGRGDPQSLAAEILAPLQFVIYHEKDSFEVDDDIREGRVGAHGIAIEFGPHNHFQSEVRVPDAILRKA